MHHVNSVSDKLKYKKGAKQYGVSISMKQIPLCYDHPFELAHKGNWNAPNQKITRKWIDRHAPGIVKEGKDNNCQI
jgi:hypothetical protein